MRDVFNQRSSRVLLRWQVPPDAPNVVQSTLVRSRSAVLQVADVGRDILAQSTAGNDRTWSVRLVAPDLVFFADGRRAEERSLHFVLILLAQWLDEFLVVIPLALLRGGWNQVVWTGMDALLADVLHHSLARELPVHQLWLALLVRSRRLDAWEHVPPLVARLNEVQSLALGLARRQVFVENALLLLVRVLAFPCEHGSIQSFVGCCGLVIHPFSASCAGMLSGAQLRAVLSRHSPLPADGGAHIALFTA